MAAGFVTGILHTFFGIPGILASILTQIGLYSVNLGIMGKSNQAVNVMQYKLIASLRYVTGEGSELFFVKLMKRGRRNSNKEETAVKSPFHIVQFSGDQSAHLHHPFRK